MESWGAAVGDGVWRKSFRECCRCGGMPSYLSQWRGRRLRGSINHKNVIRSLELDFHKKFSSTISEENATNIRLA